MGRRIAGLLAMFLVATATPARALEDLKPAPAPPRTPEFVAKVNAAVDEGLAWLATRQEVDGSFSRRPTSYPFSPPYDLGLQALSVYTVRACGMPAEKEEARLGFKRMRQIYLQHKSTGMLQNYQVSLTLLAIDAYHAPKEEPGKEDRYGRGLSGRRNIPEADLSWIRELVAWICAAQTDGSFGYDSPASAKREGAKGPWEDHSNAQFSLLALKAARRCGVEVPKRVFGAALAHFLKAQEKDGPAVTRREAAGVDEKGYGVKSRSTVQDKARGWGYQCGGRGGNFPTGAMTTAGVSSLVICRGELLGGNLDAAEDARVVQAIRDGIAWLGRNFSVTGNPSGGGTAGWHYYYLYGLERAGVLSGVSWMGDHDWYGEGADYLLAHRLKDGSWASGMTGFVAGPRRAGMAAGPGDLMDTCFALLFLKKATFRVEGAVATEEVDDGLDLAAAESADDASFRGIFDTVFARYAKAPAARRGTLVVDFVRMGKRALPLLIQRLEDADPMVREDAIAILEKITGESRGFKAADPVEARADAVSAWEEWWFARRGKLAPDVGAARFRE